MPCNRGNLNSFPLEVVSSFSNCQHKRSEMLQNVSHQVMPSPARLGLPNPNSPSLQNPAPHKFSSQLPQSHQSTQQPNLPTVTTTSSTLLPLLPPLSRAQSLLHQMTSLASRLFEVAPNRAHWVSAFRGSLPTFAQSQSVTLKSSEPSPSSSKEIISLFTNLQTQLFEAVAELQEILDLQDAKQKIANDIRSKDLAMLAFANKLKDSERVLDMLVDDYSDYRGPKRSKLEDDKDESCTIATTISTQLNLSDILSYAHRISYTTYAPPEFGAGQAPLRGALPPAPQDEQMRASQLYAFANLDIGLPMEDKLIELITDPQTQQDLSGIVPPSIVVPPGWKPGMVVELPSDLPSNMPILPPPPPPGWKPGDPVPLPPLDALVPGRTAEQLPRVPVQGIPKAPEPIQVRHVQLDIDDDSSDFSSDEASSDDEE